MESISKARVVLVAESVDDERVALFIEGRAQPLYGRQSQRFNQQRMALQLEILVKRSRYIERLADLGLTDGLTALLNRRALSDRLAQEMKVAQRRGHLLGMAMIDLDDFKVYNDTFGHLAGDELLREFATSLRDRLRGIDFAARSGGEEFCVLFPDTALYAAKAAGKNCTVQQP